MGPGSNVTTQSSRGSSSASRTEKATVSHTHAVCYTSRHGLSASFAVKGLADHHGPAPFTAAAATGSAAAALWWAPRRCSSNKAKDHDDAASRKAGIEKGDHDDAASRNAGIVQGATHNMYTTTVMDTCAPGTCALGPCAASTSRPYMSASARIWAAVSCSGSSAFRPQDPPPPPPTNTWNHMP